MLISKVQVKQDAEEVLQDTYLAFLDTLPLFRGESSLETYLWSIARHELADYWRKKYAKKAIRAIPFMDQIYVEQLFSRAETNAHIARIYSILPAKETAILKMKYEEGLNVKQIAAELRVSVKAVESRLFRARRAFQLAYVGEEK
jgi:RNA polymerase sigma-70 factor (ECF subfamily)